MTEQNLSPVPGEFAHDVVPKGMKLVDSEALLGGHKTVLIRHEGELYRLTVTRNGKLILQK